MAKRKRKKDATRKEVDRALEREKRDDLPNPPYTTTGPITVPKFGSAGSGGLENEPGPERD